MGKGASSNHADAAVFTQLQAENEALKKENAALRQRLERMNELLLNAQRTRFGQSSEKQIYVLAGGEQLRLFNEAEAVQNPKEAEPAEETLVKAHTRKPKRTIDELGAGWAGIDPCHHGQLGHSDHSDMAETCMPLTEEAAAEQQRDPRG